MTKIDYKTIYSEKNMIDIFPEQLTDQFFEALLGDAGEGAYDISIGYKKESGSTLEFEILLKERPGKCLACHLTHGLPDVLSRHPLIDLSGVVQKIADLGNLKNGYENWRLGRTLEVSKKLHVIPLYIPTTHG